MNVPKKGSLTIVGSGIELVRDTTIGARMEIENAEKVLILVTDPASELWIRKLNSNVESLFDCYVEGKPRLEAYKKMVERILKNIKDGLKVCAVFYGHPGVLGRLRVCRPGRRRRRRRQGRVRYLYRLERAY